MSEHLPAIIDRSEIIGDARAHVVPALIAVAGERASLRFLEFFAANIRNPHTRRAYSRAVSEFMAWCEDNGVTSIAAVQPLHVSAWIEQQTREHAAPTAKLRLAALRHLFNWLVTGQVSVVQGSEVGAEWAQSLSRSDNADVVRASQLQHTVEDINRHVDLSHPTFVYT
jgi:site-specific recombinase XerC